MSNSKMNRNGKATDDKVYDILDAVYAYVETQTPDALKPGTDKHVIFGAQGVTKEGAPICVLCCTKQQADLLEGLVDVIKNIGLTAALAILIPVDGVKTRAEMNAKLETQISGMVEKAMQDKQEGGKRG